MKGDRTVSTRLALEDEPMAASRNVARLFAAALAVAVLLTAVDAQAWPGRRPGRRRRPGGWNKGRSESDWYDPFWVRLRRGLPYSSSDDSGDSDTSNRYAAIAYSTSTGKYGFAHGYSSRGCAEQAALGHCPVDDAQILVWARGNWCALAVGDDVGEYGWAWAGTAEGAKQRALEECRERTTNCHIAVCVFSGN